MKALRNGLLALVLLLLPGLAAARDDSADQAVVDEFLGLIHEKDLGFTIAHQILGNSFAAHLHGTDIPVDAAALSGLQAAYDPRAGLPLSAGTAYFHLAQPIALLRRLGGGANEVFARILEYRIRWLAGDIDAARLQAEDLIVQYAAIGASDAQMVSVLADAAVLAFRTGDTDKARAYRDRALSCGEPRCPEDIVFGWLGPDPKPNQKSYAGYDADLLRDRALEDAPRLVSDPDRMLDDIRAEWAFVTGRWGRDLYRALDRVTATEDAAATIPLADRRRIRRMADRLQAGHAMAPFLLGHDSVASDFDKIVDGDGALTAQNLRDQGLSYLPGSHWHDLIVANWPLLRRLYLASDQPGDVLVARLMEARLILANGEFSRAKTLLDGIVADGQTQGFSDAALHAIWMDVWAASVLTGDTVRAAEAEAATAACRAADCPGDLVQRLSERYLYLPRALLPSAYRATLRAQADAFIRATFPGDTLKLADLYGSGAYAGASRPMDAARDASLSFDFAEAAPDIVAADLAGRASAAMDTLIYAGRYRQAAEIGDRTADRLARDGADGAMGPVFYQRRARASARLGEARARTFYAEAVTRARAGTSDEKLPRSFIDDLALDLLDTGYDALLLRLIGNDPARGDVRARVLFRQGRLDEAVAQYAGFRRYSELHDNRAREALDGLYAARAARHLSSGNLDAHVVAALRRDAIRARIDFPTDHPLVYSESYLMRAIAWQEAYYREALGQEAEATRLRGLGAVPDWPRAWPDMNAPLAPEVEAAFRRETTGFSDSMDLIRGVIDFRDTGNYQGAAAWLHEAGWVAQAAEANGEYLDAQTLWQMAYTFVRAGEVDLAFDLMDRAARIAATLSFEGAGEGKLQLLERDRWRYLLFVDIAWAALSGTPPDEMLVVSRY